MRSALFALILGTCCTAFAGEPTSVINHGASEPAAAPATIACAENCTQTEVCERTRTRCRRGLVRRAACGTVEVSRTVVRAVTRPVGRVFGGNCCCR